MKKCSGFTLVELSIVLVILGLLVGGVLSGQSLIRAAELRSVVTQYQAHRTSMSTFRDKYFALPGDMTNATSFWGTQASPLTTASTDSKTCNGDGDGTISSGNASCNESFRYWQHLANAGLIEGTYSGISKFPGFYTNVADTTNSAHGRLGNSIWYIETYGPYPTGPYILYFKSNTSGNALQFGGPTAFHDDPPTPILKPEEAWNIDTKLDDGMPATGKVFVSEPFASATALHCTSATTSSQVTATYLLTNTAQTCTLFFIQ